MLIGLVLVAVGIALLGYVATARPPRPAPGLGPAHETKAVVTSIAPRSPDCSVVVDSEDTILDPAEFEELLLPAIEPTPKGVDSKVVVIYEGEAEAEENTSPAARVLVIASGDTDRGQQRRANDDSLLVLPEHCLFAVADGMGGYAGGSVASGLAVDAMQRAFEQQHFVGDLRSASPVPRRARELASSIMQAHAAVAREARVSREHSQMGTTLVAARFAPNKQRVYIANVGDSRCYRFRRGSLRQLTCDQTMATIGLSGPHAEDLLQAIGVTAALSIDLIVDKPHAGDVYLLCSDGLNKMVADSQIRQVLARQRDLEAAVYDLIELANDAGGRDNVTVVLVRVDHATADVATIPSPPATPQGWTTLPNVVVSDGCSSDDVTVVGSLTDVELRALHVDPTRAQRRS
jgi:serine/threonine protein phosphatase PrpC